jgi:hypothetical protein
MELPDAMTHAILSPKRVAAYNPPMPEAPPQAVAKILIEELVIGRFSDHLAISLKIPEPFIQVFREKVALYRAAVILMRLIAESKHDDKFAPVQSAYEEILFGPTPTEEGLEKLKSMKAAMTDLGQIVSPQEDSRYFAWGREWYAEIGYDVTNPVTNFLLTSTWMQEFIGTSKAIKECLGVKTSD